MITVETTPHEFTANYLFAKDGLRPFFATDSAVKAGGGTRQSQFDAGGETWNATLYYQESGLVHPGETTPFGTPFEIENIREFRITVESDDDPIGERSFNAHLAPRWQGMESESNDGTRTEINVPEGIEEAVNVRVTGSNIEFSRYHQLLQSAFESVGVSSTYFESAHPYSNIQDAERYVRLHRDDSGPVHARDGPIAQMGHLLENDRTGYRKVVQNDDDERGENLPGYYHTATLGPERIAEAFPMHDLPKEIKHYYAREANNKPKSDPLAHPKLGASYQVNRWDGKLGVDEIDKLNDELEQTVLSVLADAGLSVRDSGNGKRPFFPDAYFKATEIEHDENPIVDLNLTQVRQEQESVVIKHLKDGLSPVEWESLDMLVTDGGEVSPSDIATEKDRHVDSVRRALRRIDDLVQTEYDRVSLKSNHVADLVHDAVNQAQETVKNATDTAAKAMEAAERGLGDSMSALVAWAARHDLNLNENSNGYVEIDMGTIDAESQEKTRQEIRRRLREGKKLWTDVGREPRFFEGGSWSARLKYEKYPDQNYLSQSVTKSVDGHIGAMASD